MQAETEKNLQKAVEKIILAAKSGAKIICLPELFTTLYFPQDEESDAKKFAEPIPGKTTNTLCALAKQLKIVLLAPIYEQSKDGSYFNTVVVIDESGKILDTYRKTHLPHDPLFYERNYFSDGNTGFKVIPTTYGKIAPLICFDQWFPEAARIVALQGADLIFYPTAIGGSEAFATSKDWLDAWVTIQRSHSIANGVHVASVNRVGKERRMDFFGTSFITNAFGKILVQASSTKEEIITAELNLAENDSIKHEWGFLIKRRPADYHALTDDSLRDVQQKSPQAQGYHFPAEWEPHQAVFLAWPHDSITFPNLPPAEKTYIEILKALQGNELVYLLVTGPEMKEKVLSVLKKNNLNNIKIVEHHYQDVWFRDYGPSFVINSTTRQLAMVKWKYDTYGGKYDDLLKDDTVPAFLNKYFNFPYFNTSLVMEGGSIELNGKGTLLTTASCLLDKKRNPKKTQQQIELVLQQSLAVSTIILLKRGMQGDDTDGHIDNLARFVNPTTLLCSYEEDEKDINYQPLMENYETLSQAKDQDGKHFTLVKLPTPKFFSSKKRICASYCNFYIANKAVLVPQFNLPTDKQALGIIATYFPTRKIIGIDCSTLVLGGGTIHCISQQMPKM